MTTAADLKIPALKVYSVKMSEPVFDSLGEMQKFKLAHLARHVHICDEVDGGEVARIWRGVAESLARGVVRERRTTVELESVVIDAWVRLINTVMIVDARGNVVAA